MKIPRWLTQHTGSALSFEYVRGHDFQRTCPRTGWWSIAGTAWATAGKCSPAFSGAGSGVPITNYGIAIAYSLGIFEARPGTLPAALDALRAGSAIQVQGAET